MRTAIAGALVAVGLGLAAFCCGPKVKPVLDPTCPGEKFEVCEHDDIGPHNCVCPE